MVSLVVREGAVFLVVYYDGRCDDDDATFDSFRFIYIEGCVTVIGESEVARVVSFKRAQLIRRAMR